MASENTIKLLWDAANVLNHETHSAKLLKSYYMTTCRKMAEGIQMPKEKFAVSKMCPHCSSLWNANEFSLKLHSQRIARSAKAAKLIARLDADAGHNNTSQKLTKKQRCRAKWLKKRVASTIEIQCGLCKHKALVPLEKPPKRSKQQELDECTDAAATTELDEVEAVKPAKRKKKKNKSTTAGLKIEGLKQKGAKTSKAVPHSPPEAAPIAVSKVILKQQKPVSISEKKPAIKPQNSKKPTSSANLNQTLQTKQKKKAKKGKSGGQGHVQTPATAKTQSKTQQKNSLLQLVALLKTQTQAAKTATPGASNAQKRLEKLLK